MTKEIDEAILHRQIRLDCMNKFNDLEKSINKWDEVTRHTLRNEITANNFKENDNEKQLALLQQTSNNMEKSIEEVKKILLELPNELEKKFVTKIEFIPIKEKADKHAKIFWFIYVIIWWAIIWAWIKLIII